MTRIDTYTRLELDGFHFYYSGREGDYFKHKKFLLKGTASGGHLTVYERERVIFQASLSRDGTGYHGKIDAFFDEFEKGAPGRAKGGFPHAMEFKAEKKNGVL